METETTTTQTPARDPLALLGEIRGRLTAARAESWAVSERHSRDLSDEGWSEVAITITDESLPLPPQVALTYLSGLLEPDNEEANTAFIVGAGKDIARLLAIPDALLADHHVEPLYEAAENCGHTEPDRAADIDAWEAWNSDHPWGAGPDGEDDTGDRICRLTQNGEHCAGCSEWLAREYGGDDFVHPGNCLVRPVIAAALNGEETPS